MRKIMKQKKPGLDDLEIFQPLQMETDAEVKERLLSTDWESGVEKKLGV